MQADQALTLAGLSASWLALSGGTWKLFEIADKAASRQASDFVGAWLRRETATPAGQSLAYAFGNAMQSVFGARLLSVRAFVMSCVVSTFWIAVIAIFWNAAHPFAPSEADIEIDAPPIAFILLLGLVFNAIPDYLSLAKTRIFMAMARRSTNWRADLGYLAADFIGSAVLAIATLALLNWFQLKPGDSYSDQFSEAVQDILGFREFQIRSIRIPVGVYMAATFLSSFWLWLYYLSSLATRIGRGTHWFMKGITKVVNVDEHPFFSIGLMAIVLETMGFGVVALLAVVRQLQT